MMKLQKNFFKFNKAKGKVVEVLELFPSAQTDGWTLANATYMIRDGLMDVEGETAYKVEKPNREQRINIIKIILSSDTDIN